MNCSQMNTLACLIQNSVAENLCKVSSLSPIKGKTLSEEKQIIGRSFLGMNSRNGFEVELKTFVAT